MTRTPVCTAVVLMLLSAAALAAQEAKPSLHAPDALPGVEPEMLGADYWIALQPDADTVILTPEQIARFNAAVREHSSGSGFEGSLANTLQPLDLPATLPGDSLRTRLEHNRTALYTPEPMYGSREYYDDRLLVYSRRMKDELAAKMNIAAIPKTITRRYGLVVNHTGLRQYPTATPGYSETRVVMDRFQITELNIGYPVTILHESSEGDFLFVETPLALGWAPAADIALASRETIRKIIGERAILLATGERIPVYGDPGFRSFSRHLFLSETLPLEKKDTKGYRVRIPYRGPDGSLRLTTGYMRPDADVHEGLLPYTKRSLLTVMFKLLNSPYGWHGQDNKRDCVGALRTAFRCMGIETGRNIGMASEHRIPMDPKLSPAEKREKAASIEPVITVASSPDHVALFLGKAGNGKLYFMHQGGWGYDEGDVHYIVNRVSLNEADHPWFSIAQPTLYTVMR